MKKLAIGTMLVALLVFAGKSVAVRIGDVTNLQGQHEKNRLTGVGLVIGLNGTGDGGKFLPAIRPLAAYLQHFQNSILSLDELKSAKNVALVEVSAVIGKNGARQGDALDVSVSTLGSAKSLEGGRLMIAPLKGPLADDPVIYALAGGPISVDPKTPTGGIIKGGAVMEEHVIYNLLDGDTFTLIIDDAHASYQMATAIAEAINGEESVLGSQAQSARVVGPKAVCVTIPKAERSAPANFIARIQRLALLMPEKQAKVTINARTGTIVIDGDVTIAPSTVVCKGMTISTDVLVKERQASAGEAAPKETYDVPDIELKFLVEAFNRLAVPIEDRIAVIRELASSGNLQGQLVEQP